ncbi:MAG: hypothetical protein MJ131_04740 [Lachnospiraceae bacterium]|nr:hypothetical protein [Lachnospiraceae bacterium]
MSKAKKTKEGRASVVITVVIALLICGWLFKITMDLRNTEKSLDEALVILEEQKAAARQEHTNLENEIAYRETDDYVKDQAKEIFGLRDPEDTIFIPGSDEAADEKK